MREIRPVTKVIIIKNGKILLLLRNKNLNEGETIYDIPGGGVEFGETFEDALTREVNEEVNLEIDIKGIVSNWSYTVNDELHLVGLTFFAEYVSGNVKLSGEHESYQWIDINKINYFHVPKWLEKEVNMAIKKFNLK